MKNKINTFKPLDSSYLNNEQDYEQEKVDIENIEKTKEIIDYAFESHGVQARVKDYFVGPSITRFNLETGTNCSSKSLGNVISYLQTTLGGLSVRYDSGSKGYYNPGLEVENTTRRIVPLKVLYDKLPDAAKYPLVIPLGQRADGEVAWTDLKEAPHVLMSGTTGSGKSVFINTMITSLMMRNSPEELRFVLFDPKHVELNRYKESPHLLCPIVHDANEAKKILEKLIVEMENRYAAFYESNSCNIAEHNKELEMQGLPKIPHIVVIIDEYADLLDCDKSIANPVISLAQKARAAGIHLVVATQRPAPNVVSGVLKANLPLHIAFMTPSAVDSVVIIGEPGAERLLGRGDMLVQSPLLGLTRLQGSFARRDEIKRVVEYFKERCKLQYNPKFLLD